jgi:hypothetical protein
MIMAIEVMAGVRAELTGRQLAMQIAVGILFGMLVIVLRLILH